MRPALYARVSTETQAQEGTIESQIHALREYAKANNLEIAHDCIDDGYSGTSLVRPGLDRLRDLAAQAQIDAVLILAPDRLARSNVLQAILLDEFKKRGVRVIFSNFKNEGTDEDNLLLGLLGAISEYERAKILDRTRRGRLQAARNGAIIGGQAPYGYRLIRKSKETPAHYEIDPVQAETVRLIFRLVTKDKLSLRATAKYLTERGIPTRTGRGEWQSSTLADMLRNESYTGTAYFFRHAYVEPKRPRSKSPYRKVRNTARKPRPQSDWIPIPVPPIIDRATFDAARAQLAINTERSSRNNWHTQYLLRLKVVCGLCDCHISGISSNHYSYYRCDSRTHGRKNAIRHDESVSVRHQKLDDLVWSALTDLMDNPDLLEEHVNKRLEADTPPDPSIPGLEANEKALANVETEEERLVDAYREQAITLPQLKAQLKKVTDKRTHLNALRNELTRSKQPPRKPAITRAMLGDLSARYRRAMASADFPARRKIVEQLVNEVTLYPGRAVVHGAIPIENCGLRTEFPEPPSGLARCR